MRSLFSSFALATAFIASAQITQVGSVNIGLRPILTLPDQGLMYASSITGNNQDQVIFYNADMTQAFTVTLPAVPAFYNYANRAPVYVTTNLFDTDPSSIEFVMFVDGQFSTFDGIRVVRQDGTLVFEDLNHVLYQTFENFYETLNSSDILNAPDGNTYMVLTDRYTSSVVYQLPGVLPCVSCDGTTSGLTEGPNRPELDVRVFPNPNSGQFTVELELNGLVSMQVFDGRGALVHTEVFTAQGTRTQRTLDLSRFATGSYTLRIEHDGQRVSQTVVVE